MFVVERISRLFLIHVFMVMATSCAPLEPSRSPESKTEVLKESSKKETGDSKAPGNASVSMAAALGAPESITFSDVKTLVFNEACIYCHSSTGSKLSNVALDSYGHALGQKASKSVIIPFNPEESSLYTSLLVESGSRHMPPFDKPQLTDDQKNLVFLWISNGAKENAKQVVKRPLSLSEVLGPYFRNPERIDYSVVKKHVFDTGCLDCHSKEGPKADFEGAIIYGQDMSDYQALFSNHGIVIDRLTNYVVRENGRLKKKKGSRIYRAVGTEQTMPRPMDGYDPIDSRRVKLLRLWIKNCAIESYSDILEDKLLDPKDPLYVNGKVRRCSDSAE